MLPPVRSALISSCALFALIAACGKTNPDAGSTTSTATSAATPAPSASVAENAAPGPLIAPDADHVGGVIARAPNSDSVYIADEDHGLVRFVADTAAFLARLRGEDVATLTERTAENFHTLFAKTRAA